MGAVEQDRDMPQLARARDERVAVIQESLRLRCAQAIQALVPMSVGLPVIGALMWTAVSSPSRLLAWLLSCYAATVIAAIDCKYIINHLDSASEEMLARLNNRFLVTTVLNTVAVGSGVWWVATGSSHEIGFFITLCLCFYAFGHLINGSSHMTSFNAGLATNLGQAMAFWLTQDIDGVAIAALLACITYLLFTFARQNSKAFAESIHMRFESRELLAALSEKKEATDRALAAAEEANRAKSRFLAAASHDLRQPLHALGLWAGLLRGSLTTPVSIERAEKLLLCVDSLDKMFAGLLDLSRLDAGSVTAEKRGFALQPLLQGLDNDIRSEARAKGIGLEVAATSAWVYSDPLWFERILRNLLSNAIRYTSHGTVSVRCEQGADTVRVVVQDTGIGIAADEQQRVFEEYYQLHNPARDRNHGVGLGLAIVKRLCDLLGHPISLESTPGVGSEFAVVLPVCKPGAAAGRESDFAEWRGRELAGIVVVLVEDDQDVAGAMAEMLREWGCESVVCQDADAAIAMLTARSLRPHAVISDYRLRDNLTGVEVIGQLRAKYGPVPAVLITGEINIPGVQGGKLDCQVLQKPLAPARIKELLLQFRSAA